jgi:hypothetical protein
LWTIAGPIIHIAAASAKPPSIIASQGNHALVAFGRSTVCAADVAVPLGASIANARSLADWNRRSTFFSRHRPRIRCSPIGPCHPVSFSSGGSSRKIAAIVSATVSRLKARLPVNIL